MSVSKWKEFEFLSTWWKFWWAPALEQSSEPSRPEAWSVSNWTLEPPELSLNPPVSDPFNGSELSAETDEPDSRLDPLASGWACPVVRALDGLKALLEIVIRQPDHSLKASSFHVRFGKLRLLRSKQKKILFRWFTLESSSENCAEFFFYLSHFFF